MPKCWYHDSTEANTICTNCGKFICRSCLVVDNDKALCHVCAVVLVKKVEPGKVASEETEVATIDEKVKAETPAVSTVPAEQPAQEMVIKASEEADTPPSKTKIKLPEVKAGSIKKTLRSTKSGITSKYDQVKTAALKTATTVKESDKGKKSTALAKDKKDAGKTGKISGIWWIAPILFCFIGGVIAWILNKGKDARQARVLLYTGLGMTLVPVLISVILVATGNPSKPTTDSGDEVSTIADNQQPVDNSVLTTLVEQEVDASSEDQVVSYGDDVSVTIPAGGLDEPQELKISEVANAPPASGDEMQLAVYDISFEKQHDFSKELTFRFAYDPAQLPADTPAWVLLGVSYFDELLFNWQEVPFVVDEASHQVEVNSYHNGKWQLVARKNIKNWRKTFITDHFAINYWPLEFDYGAESNRLKELQQQASDLLKQIKQAQSDIDRLDALIKSIESDTVLTPEAKTSEINNIEKDKNDITVQKDKLTASRDEITTELDELNKALGEGQEVTDYPGSLPDDARHYYSEYSNVPKYVIDIAYYLEKAWDTYERTFSKKIPQSYEVPAADYVANWSGNSNFIDVVGNMMSQKKADASAKEQLTEMTEQAGIANRFPVYVSRKYEAAQFEAKSNSISIGLTSGGTLDYNLCHELFHAVQNVDYNLAASQSGLTQLPGKLGLTYGDDWWFEPTADYAAFVIALGQTQPSNHELTDDYFQASFFDAGTEETNSPRYQHAYRNAYFWDYLVWQRGIDFIGFYNTVVGQSGIHNPEGAVAIAQAIENYISSHYPCDDTAAEHPAFGDAFRDFAEYSMLDANSPCQKQLVYETMPPTEQEKEVELTLSSDTGYRAVYAGVMPEIVSGQDSRRFNIQIVQLPSGISLDVYRLPGNQPVVDIENYRLGHWGSTLFRSSGNAAPLGNSESLNVTVKKGESLYFLATDLTSAGGTIGAFVKIADGGDYFIDIKADPIPGVVNEESYFEAIVKDKDGQDAITKIDSLYLEWEFGDGASESGDGQGAPGISGTVAVTHAYKADDTYRVKVDVFSGKKKIGSGAINYVVGKPGANIVANPPIGKPEQEISFTAHADNIPGDASYRWYFGDLKNYIEGSESVKYTYDSTGTFPVKVLIYWKNAEGKLTEIWAEKQMEIKEWKLKIIPLTPMGIAGQQSVFKPEDADGGELPDDTSKISYSWAFGDFTTEGDYSTTTDDIKGKHIYAKTAKYKPSVTMIQTKTGKQIGSGQLQYTVVLIGIHTIDGTKGTVGNTYNFAPVATYIPDDAVYTWSVDGKDVMQGKKDSIYPFKPTIPGTDYLIKVTATWKVDGIEMKATAPVTFTTEQAASALSIIVGDGLEGTIGGTYRFAADAQNMPLNVPVTYDWSVDGSVVGSTQEKDAVFKLTPQYEKDYVIKVVASWQANGKKQQMASNEVIFTCSAGASLSLDIPSGVTVESKECTITAVPGNIPPNALYTWYFNGQQIVKNGEGRTSIRILAPSGGFNAGSYEVIVTASWTDTAGKSHSLSKTGTLVVKDVSSGVYQEGRCCRCGYQNFHDYDALCQMYHPITDWEDFCANCPFICDECGYIFYFDPVTGTCREYVP